MVSLRFKGDPSLAGVADTGTAFWLSFYDKSGASINYISDPAPVVSADCTNLTAHLQDFGNTSTVDIGNLVQWRILVEGWMGTADSSAMTGTFYVDDIRITVPPAQRPSLALVQQAGTLTLSMGGLVPGNTYALRQTSDFSQWTTATNLNATATTATWAIPTDQPQAFFQLLQTSP